MLQTWILLIEQERLQIVWVYFQFTDEEVITTPVLLWGLWNTVGFFLLMILK